MAMNAFLLISGLVVFAQAPVAPSPVVVACRFPGQSIAGAPASAPTERVFRLAPGSFQEWDAATKKFGQNICLSYACAKTPDRTEGSISSASVSYTVGITNGTGDAYWRAQGASGLAANHGACRVVAQPTSRVP